jgi:hypothetical protein
MSQAAMNPVYWDFDYANHDIDEIIKEARKRAKGQIDPRLAMQLLVGKLQYSRGYYQWAHIEGNWMIRVPAGNRTDSEKWLNSEPPEIIHVCESAKFAGAVETMANKEQSSQFVGYMMDSDDPLKVACSRCKNVCSEDGAKRGLVQVKLMLVHKKTS